ncbi:hypothetical protein KSP39_PZI017252 [Platanthera zijinensis]|uniref:Uncharacterized protein n=1 Tax=Platanthera zijinensis TaxID=2320716 RepID=A0AAP0B540_9ASPA
MPGLLQRGAQLGPAPVITCSAFSGAAGSLPVSNTIWSRQREDVSFDQLRKFWGELPTQARRELLRIDKQTLCEQARKNLYCSRCHGLLLECYSQIVMYGKSLQQEFVGGCFLQKTAEVLTDNEYDNLQDPSVHPWGGLTTTKDGMLTLLDCFTCASSLDVIHKVFSSARQREHDRELLYPDACGGGGRGWISQGLANYGRGHGTRETCSLHTSRLSCDTLLDFWSALGDETRSSLLHMKEEDFIERLMYRFDSKRFCRDCRRNVLREFKELKELKRLRKELRCSSWFCVADTTIHYEVSEDSVLVDWRHSFADTSTYHHFEWAVGTAEGKDDILDFEDVGMNGKVEVEGLDLSGLSACFITLKAWKLDGRCNELSVKAHALKGQACVHRRLIIGDGFVAITEGDSIKSFFEHAEEIEEEEDDDSVDKDGIEFDGDGSRSQKHAKSPELAREFLLDAATVIFKEQVEKAFREGTARQNSHSLFVSLAIKLLEDCVHVACKEIITLEKQIKLLEEEENEKREEEERRERRRNKEREKKLRRKERMREKDKDREMKLIEGNPLSVDLSTSTDSSLTNINNESLDSTPNSEDSLCDLGDNKTPVEPIFSDITDNTSVYEYFDTATLQSDSPCHQGYLEEGSHFSEINGSLPHEQSRSSRRKLLFKRVTLQDQAPKWYGKHRSSFTNAMSIQQESSIKLKASSRCLTGGRHPFRERVARVESRNCIGTRIKEKFHSSQDRIHDAYDSQPCRTAHPGEYRPKDRNHISTIRGGREVKSSNTADLLGNLSRQPSHYNKHNRGCYVPDNGMVPKGKLVVLGASGRDPSHARQVWEPTDARKKYNRSNLGANVTSTTDAKTHPSKETRIDTDEKDHEPSAEVSSSDFSQKNSKVDSMMSSANHMDGCNDLRKSDSRNPCSCQGKFLQTEKSLCCSKANMISSSSDSCSSCPSEGDSTTSFSSTSTVETSSISDSEDAAQVLDQRDISKSNGDAHHLRQCSSPHTASHQVTTSELDESRKVGYSSAGGSSKFIVPATQQTIHMHKHSPIPTFPSEIMHFENQSMMAWPGAPINGSSPFPRHHHYMFPSPVGFGLPANRSPGFAMHYNALQPPIIVEQHHLCPGIFRASTDEQSKNSTVFREERVTEVAAQTMNESREHPPSEWTRRSQERENSFSLFHFGGPPVGSAAAYGVKLEYAKEHTGHSLKSVESQDNISCSMEETKIEEYSLFATKNSSRFCFLASPYNNNGVGKAA